MDPQRWRGYRCGENGTCDACPGWKGQIIPESEMVLFCEWMQLCAQIVFDTADIIRDGHFSTSTKLD